jgi:threonine/homoserine/homoserine lactone efflux protein
MNNAALAAFAVFAFVASITPGPNNLMLLASGMNFGFRASVPHMLGINLGFLIMLLAVGFGLGELFVRYPALYSILKWLGAAYLLWLAWRIANAGPAQSEDGPVTGRPLGFPGAALFQWVNPKAWAMAVTAFSAYVPTSVSWRWELLVAGLFALINAPCITVWTLFGATLKRWLREPRAARIFNWTMAALLLVSLVPMLS